MNLNTVPRGDMALGYDVARKYSSPGSKQEYVSSVTCVDSRAKHCRRLITSYLLHLQRMR